MMRPAVSLIDGRAYVTMPPRQEVGQIAYGCWLCKDSGVIATFDQFGNPWGWRCRCPAGAKAAGAPQVSRNDYVEMYRQAWPDFPVPPY